MNKPTSTPSTKSPAAAFIAAVMEAGKCDAAEARAYIVGIASAFLTAEQKAEALLIVAECAPEA